MEIYPVGNRDREKCHPEAGNVHGDSLGNKF
jgi:hypothetical protein